MADNARVKEYIDWAVRGLVAGLLASSIATAKWAINNEQRVHDLEAWKGSAMERLATLEAKDDSYQHIRTDIAVLKTKIDQQTEQQKRIEDLIQRIAH